VSINCFTCLTNFRSGKKKEFALVFFSTHSASFAAAVSGADAANRLDLGPACPIPSETPLDHWSCSFLSWFECQIDVWRPGSNFRISFGTVSSSPPHHSLSLALLCSISGQLIGSPSSISHAPGTQLQLQLKSQSNSSQTRKEKVACVSAMTIFALLVSLSLDTLNYLNEELLFLRDLYVFLN